METGELKTIVMKKLREHQEASVSDLIQAIEKEFGREYAYSTIATILSRLEEEEKVTSEKKRKYKRKKTYYRLVRTAHKDEAASFLRSYISKFGDVGIRHLGDLMGTNITKDELEELRDKIMQSDEHA